MVSFLMQYYRISDGILKSVSDNKGAIHRLSRNANTNLAIHKESEADLLLFHHSLRRRGPATTSYQLDSGHPPSPLDPLPLAGRNHTCVKTIYSWVRGHQDSVKPEADLSIMERLNIRMDDLASQAHDLPHDWSSSPSCRIFPGERWGVFHKGCKITSGLKEGLIAAFQERDTIAYLQAKYSFTDPVFHTIGWQHFKTLFKQKSAHQRAMVSKYVHGWTPTSAFLRRQGRDVPTCPFCDTSSDQKDHHFTCTSSKAMSFRATAWANLIRCLLDANGCRHTVDMIASKVRASL